MRKWIAAAIVLLAGSPAFAQAPQLGSGQVFGNPTAALRNGLATDISPLFDRAFGAVPGSVFSRGPTVWAASRTPVLGVAGTATGTLGFCGLTSGCMTISAQSVAGTGTLLLPNLAGTIVASATSPLVASATTGVVSCPTCVTSSGGGAITGTAPINVSAAGVVSITSPLPLTNGGSNASLTASNGGIWWSNATQGQILAGTATARLPLLSGATATPVWGAFTLPASVTSGGAACYTSTTAQGSSVLLTANALVLGGGAGVCPSPMASLGTTTTVLHGNAAGAPTFGQIVVGDVTPGALTNSTLANMPAYTLKGNSSGSPAAPTDIDITALPLKAAPVAADIALIQDSAASNAYKRATVGSIASAGSVADVNGIIGSVVLWTPPQGRLSLTSGTPVMSTSVAAATSFVYTAFAGRNIPIYNGSKVAQYQICSTGTVGACELAVFLGSNWTANSIFDAFVAYNAGVPTLCTGPAWSANTRPTGAATSETIQYDGLPTNRFSLTCRNSNSTTITVPANQGTWVGTVHTDVAGQINYIFGGYGAGGVAANFGVYNGFNRVDVNTQVGDTTASWSYSTAVWRSANASNNMRVSFVNGSSSESSYCDYNGLAQTTAATNVVAIGVGFNSTAAFSGQTSWLNLTGAANGSARYSANVEGFNFCQAIEYTQAGTGTYYGTAGQTFVQTGINAKLRL